MAGSKAHAGQASPPPSGNPPAMQRPERRRRRQQVVGLKPTRRPKDQTARELAGSAEGFPPRRKAARGRAGSGTRCRSTRHPAPRRQASPARSPRGRDDNVRRDTKRCNPPGARDSSRLATAGGTRRPPNAVTRATTVRRKRAREPRQTRGRQLLQTSWKHPTKAPSRAAETRGPKAAKTPGQSSELSSRKPRRPCTRWRAVHAGASASHASRGYGSRQSLNTHHLRPGDWASGPSLGTRPEQAPGTGVG